MGPLSFISHKTAFALFAAILFATIGASTLGCQTLATSVPLLLPTNIAVDTRGNLYVSETGRHLVRRIDAQGLITTVAGTGTQGFDGDGGQATTALLDSPLGLVVDAGNLYLYIADSHNHRIRRVDLRSGLITTFAGGRSSGETGDGGQAINARLERPAALAIDGAGSLFIADSGDHRIRKIAVSGLITTVAGTGVQGMEGDSGEAISALIDSPSGLAVDASGNIYLADTHNNRVRQINGISGSISAVAGIGKAGYKGDGSSAVSAALFLPRGISVDEKGNVYIADSANHRIRRVEAATGDITTIAGDGVQGYRGDGGAPEMASLDSPSAVSVATNDAVNLVDMGNERVRQITTGSLLQTVAGLGALSPGALTLSGPSVVSYGSGQLLANLNGTDATGSITFLDISSGSAKTLRSIALENGKALLDLSEMNVGQYRIAASYAGDQAHSAAQSPVSTVTVSPVELTVVATPSTIEYGAISPTLQSTIAGLLPRDIGDVTAILTTTVTTISPVGSYPIHVTLSGKSAANYLVPTVPTFSIVPAQTSVSLSLDKVSATTGQPVTLTVKVASSTGPIPSGNVNIMDGGLALGSGSLDAAGQFSWTSTSLVAGLHTLTAIYTGTTNFRSSTATPSALTVSATDNTPADFTMSATGAVAQTIAAGGTASFTFNVKPQTGLASQISFNASGAPGGASIAFNPGYVPPGSSAVVTMTITTQKSARLEQLGGATVLVGFIFCFCLRRRYAAVLALIPLCLTAGCGDRIATSSTTEAASKQYTIVVSGTGTGVGGVPIQHSLTYTLTVVSSN